MNIALGQRLIATVAVGLALWFGWLIAGGENILPAFVAALLLVGSLAYFLHVSVGTVLLGVVLVGYVVGNRGFAQLMVVPGLPLLPAEIALAGGGAWVLWRCAFTRQLPLRPNFLNGLVLLWLVVGSARVAFDVRIFGFLALRDFAMVYYAVFFFLAQELAGERGARRFLLGALLFASLAQPLAVALSTAFPDFFYTVLTWRGVPLILFKGDLALTFTAVSAFVLAFATPGRWRPLARVIASAELVLVIGGDNRASMLGALAGLAWLALSRARRFVGAQALLVAGALTLVAGLATLTEARWAEAKFHGVVERVQSLTDLFGRGTYVTDESAMKGDNNRFRTLWWKSVIDETLTESPVFGLGFGHDLARNFLRGYNPEMADDFTARSPHSLLVTTFGRMGFTGLAVLAALLAALAMRTRRAMRAETTSDASLGLWAGVWSILVSACFGVVLEGPMGAVVFWSLLGVLSAKPTDESLLEAAPGAAAATAAELESAQESKSQPAGAATLRSDGATPQVRA